MTNIYIISFLAALVLAAGLVQVIKKLALRFKIVDSPRLATCEKANRKVHDQPIPLLGGMGIFVAFFTVTFFLAYQTDYLVGKNISLSALWGVFAGGLLLMIGGFLDDKYNLTPGKQIIWPVMAALALVLAGIGPSIITNPLGGVFHLDTYSWPIFELGGKTFYFVALTSILTFVWLMGMMYTTKFLDGLDGLVSGITTIACVIIFFLSIATKYFQPDTALLAITLAGAALGFLIFNFHPAKIFLGEGGSLFTGFMLGTLAIIAGGKIATALLIMGIPILDVAWVIVRRTFVEKKSPFKTADRKHLHYRLLDIGLSHRQAVIFIWAIATVFGIAALFLQSKEKLLTLGILFLIMLALGAILVILYKRKIKT